MAANVESMFYIRETPWHGLGTKVQEAPTSKDALILAGLDWHVIQEPVYTGKNELVQGYKANVRNSDRKVLGVVTDRYKIVQNEEAFSFTDALLGEGVRYETAGSLQGGKSVWLLAHLPHEYIISGERISPYLLFSNTHDGSGAVKVAITPSPFSADKWEDDKIPLSYQIQCYHYMSVMNADRWYVAVLIYGTEFKVYCLERDEEMIQNLIQIEKDFWNNHVQAGVIPEPDGSKLADKVLTEYFSDPVDEIVELSGYQEKLERRGELKKLIEKMTTEVSLIEQEIKLLMGNAERAKADNYRISWKASQRTDLDSKRMKAEEPEIYDRFKRTSVSRRFVVRAA